RPARREAEQRERMLARPRLWARGDRARRTGRARRDRPPPAPTGCRAAADPSADRTVVIRSQTWRDTGRGDRTSDHILHMSDALSDGIVKQFPEKFGSPAGTTTARYDGVRLRARRERAPA